MPTTDTAERDFAAELSELEGKLELAQTQIVPLVERLTKGIENLISEAHELAVAVAVAESGPQGLDADKQ